MHCLFLALSSAAFGEVQLGIRLATALHARGDRATFLAPSAHAVLFRETPFTFGAIDKVRRAIDRAIFDVLRARACDVVVLLDASLTYLACQNLGVDPEFLRRLPVPVVALDVWNLVETELRWDTAAGFWDIPREVLDLKRIVPVPFVRPSGFAGLYDALPPPMDTEDRATTRAALGIGAGEHVILFTTARFQAQGWTPLQERLVAMVPNVLRPLSSFARVLHIGPLALSPTWDGYQHLGQVPPRRMRALLRASDLLLTANQAATTISTALVDGVPVIAGIHSPEGPDGFPFRVLPLGLHRFMAPLLAENPYLDAIHTVELLAPDFPDRCREVLRDPAALLAGAAAYVRQVRSLPTSSEAFDRALRGS